MKLASLQNQFQNYLLQTNNLISESVTDTEKISGETRLAIYKDAYYSRLLEALETTYPILKKYMGKEAFDKLGYAYIHQYPSIYRSIRWFGDQLDIFLNEQSEYQISLYSELAKFEWTMSLVFDALDADSITLEEIGNIDPNKWESMQFKAHPSTHCFQLKWNVIAIWQALSEDTIPPDPLSNESFVHHIAWRHDLTSHFCSLPEEEAWSLNAMLRGATFGEICEGLCQWHNEEDAPIHAASLLKGWITAGLISQVSEKEAATTLPLFC